MSEQGDKVTSSIEPTTGLQAVLRTRGLFIYLAIAIAGPLLCAFATGHALGWMQRPDVGILLMLDTRVNIAASRWGDLRRGDEILSVNGLDVRDEAHLKELFFELDAGPVRLEVARGDQRFDLSAQARQRGLREQVAIGARVVIGAAMFLIGVVAFFLSPGRKIIWLFLLFTTSAAAFLWLVVFMERFDAAFLYAVYTSIALAVGFGLHLFVEFPRRLSWFGSRPWSAALFYTPGLLCVLLFFLSEQLGVSNTLRFWARTSSSIWLAVGGTVGLGFLLMQQRQAWVEKDYRARVRCRIIVTGAALGLALPSLFHALRVILGIGAEEWIIHLNIVPVLVFVAMTAYALVRHNVLAVDRFALAVVGYSITLCLLGLVFAALLLGLPVLVGQASALRSPAAVAALTALGFVGFGPVYRRLKRRVDTLFARASPDSESAAAVLRELSRVIQGSDRLSSFEAGLQALQTLYPERVELWTLVSDGQSYSRVAGAGRFSSQDALPRDGAMVSALAKDVRGGGLRGMAPLTLDAAAQVELEARGWALAVPVLPFGKAAALIGLGRKLAGTAFSVSELTFVEAVATQLALVMERASSESAQLGRYRVERRLGVGGMAEVFLAWQLGPGGFERAVALKRLLPNFAEEPELVAMFLDEARIAAQLRHRHIVQIYEVGKEAGVHFIAMEYVDGPSLRQLIRAQMLRREVVPLPLALAIALATLKALGHAHAAVDDRGRPLEVVHRDVTPSNVQLTRDGEVKLLDFGIARAATQLHVTRSGVAKGTLPYMSAEQVLAEPLDARADLYSLAAVLYEVLTCSRAFAEGPRPERPPRPSALREELPVTMDEVLERGLAYEARDRFRSAEAMADALRLAAHPVQAASQVELAAWIDQRVPAQPLGAGPDVPTASALVPPEDLSSQDTTPMGRAPRS